MNEGEKKFTLSSKNTYMKVKGVKSGCQIPNLSGVLEMQKVADMRGVGVKYADVLYRRPLSPGAGLPYSGAPD